MRVHVIRTDGQEEHTECASLREVNALIHAEVCDTVNLRDGRVMLVDDLGWEYVVEKVEESEGRARYEHRPVRARKPVNEKATKLYHKVCKPGTTHQIVGDVAIVVDREV